jgi:nicotinic acid mononucleotide adenylyltransferase
MNWKIETAQQDFFAVLAAAEQNPQLIYEHNRAIAAVIGADLLQAFLAWQAQQQPSLAQTFAELRQLCAEENYTFEVPSRCDRSNPFANFAV